MVPLPIFLTNLRFAVSIPPFVLRIPPFFLRIPPFVLSLSKDLLTPPGRGQGGGPAHSILRTL